MFHCYSIKHIKRLSCLISSALLLSSCGVLTTEDESKILPGDRVELLPNDAASQIVKQADGVTITLPQSRANYSWLPHIYGHLALDETIGRVTKIYTPKDQPDSPAGIAPEPIIIRGKIAHMDRNGVVSLMDEDGSITWQATDLVGKARSSVGGGGIAFNGTTVFAATPTGYVAAFAPSSGKLLWLRRLPAPIRAVPSADDSRLYVITADNILMALDEESGALRWKYDSTETSIGLLGSAGPRVMPQQIAGLFSSGEIVMLKSDIGRELWQNTLSVSKEERKAVLRDIIAMPVVAGNAVVVADTDHTMIAFDKSTGQRLWKQQRGFASTPWISGETLFAIDSNQHLYAIWLHDGSVIWDTALPQPGDDDKSWSWNGPVLANGRIWLTSEHGMLQTIDAKTGEKGKSWLIPGGIRQRPVISSGKLWLIDKNAGLHQFR